MTYSIRDVLWLMVVVGLVAVIVRDRWQVRYAPLALDGFCPVTVIHSERWQHGDTKCQTVHEGHRYLFVSAAEKELFLSDPRPYVPVCGSNDVVRLTDENRQSPGSREYGLSYNSRIYLFDSEFTIRKFEANPTKYAQPSLPKSSLLAPGIKSSALRQDTQSAGQLSSPQNKTTTAKGTFSN